MMSRPVPAWCVLFGVWVLSSGCNHNFVFERSEEDSDSPEPGETGDSGRDAETETDTDTESGSDTPGDTETDDESWKPRVIHTTDLQVDDRQSLVRQLVMADWFDIEGLIVSTSCLSKTPRDRSYLDTIVDAYAAVVANLKAHDAAFPDADDLRTISVAGQTGFGMADVCDDCDSPGSALIVDAVDRDDPRPVWVACWGGCNTLAQAIWNVQTTRSEGELADFLSKLRVYDVQGQDEAGAFLSNRFPELFYIRAEMNQSWQPSESWVAEHVQSHGALGAVYPDMDIFYEVDAAAFLHLVPNGLHDPDKIEQGGWGGRFGSEKLEGVPGMTCSEPLNEAAYNPYYMYTEAAESISRWSAAIHNDFEARMDWSMSSDFRDANHHPVAVVNGDAGRRVLTISVSAGARVELTADGSSDPDGDALTVSWWFYEEPSSYDGAVTIQNSASASATVLVPSGTGGETIHIILEIVDDGAPPLTSYRRVVLDVSD